MKRLAFALLGALALGAAAPSAHADEPGTGTWRTPPAGYRDVERPRVSVRRVVRPIVREVVRERPVYVYRTRRVVREVVVERPVYLRPRPVYREVFVDGPYGPPPPYFGRPFFRPRPVFAYGPGPFLPYGPRRFGWGGAWGPGPFF